MKFSAFTFVGAGSFRLKPSYHVSSGKTTRSSKGELTASRFPFSRVCRADVRSPEGFRNYQRLGPRRLGYRDDPRRAGHPDRAQEAELRALRPRAVGRRASTFRRSGFFDFHNQNEIDTVRSTIPIVKHDFAAARALGHRDKVRMRDVKTATVDQAHFKSEKWCPMHGFSDLFDCCHV